MRKEIELANKIVDKFDKKLERIANYFIAEIKQQRGVDTEILSDLVSWRLEGLFKYELTKARMRAGFRKESK